MTASAAGESATWINRSALCAEPRAGVLYVFMPPVDALDAFEVHLRQAACGDAPRLHRRLRVADGLLKVARRDDGSVERVTMLIQAMDAVLRRVPLPEGERPAPEEVKAGGETWVRAVAPY